MKQAFRKLTILIFALTLVAGFSQAEASKVRLVIGTGGLGGVYYYYGTTVAEIISKAGEFEATAMQTAASVDNLQLIQKRTDPEGNVYYLACVLPDSAYLAYTGQHEKFKDQPAKDVRILWTMYPNYLHIVTKEGSGIETVADLKGKRVSTGAPGSGTEVEAFMVLEAAGISTSDFAKHERLGASESAEALSAGTIDAYFWSGGLPTSSITELATTLKRKGSKIKLIGLPADGDIVKNIASKFPGVCEPATIAASVYGTSEDTPTLAFWNLFMGPASLPEEVAYKITKTVFEKLEELHSAVKPSKATTPENAVKFVGGTIPYHPGSLKYFKEIGVLK
ncbi:TAXI family TRAP transporter solute-binding subunit [Thermodesulforhabdus norvegica]|uniref:TAXI family TRAP transporter solute-binding subunit n=1 Tax=Thermodesulforhabdus norvegica TaxID=39841 RepID=A0A1I4QUE7_9BACT|nr:TAXI family TRAP transporter solute-binding subunit [Thermodesulforhabdus norvegica]SFM43385.1 hypothetical protein SAMN05660836_00217 [Thermodesulforhabdus norvegica]